MSCEELRDHYELYALGLAEDPESSELRAHLNRGCGVCLAGVRGAREVLSFLAGSAPQVAPPKRLRKRILASVGAERAGWSWTPLAIAAGAACLFAAFYYYNAQRDAGQELARLREQARRQSLELARVNEALTLLNARETRQVSFGEGATQPPRGKVFVHPAAGVLLLASNLPPAPAGKIYEMWVIPKGGKPVPAGLFQSEAGGTAMHLLKGPVDVAGTGAVAVTLEAAGGAPQPTSQPVIVAPLGD